MEYCFSKLCSPFHCNSLICSRTEDQLWITMTIYNPTIEVDCAAGFWYALLQVNLTTVATTKTDEHSELVCCISELFFALGSCLPISNQTQVLSSTIMRIQNPRIKLDGDGWWNAIPQASLVIVTTRKIYSQLFQNFFMRNQLLRLIFVFPHLLTIKSECFYRLLDENWMQKEDFDMQYSKPS